MKQEVSRVYLIRTDRGTWANHHDAFDPQWGRLIGERVTPATATHATIWFDDGSHELIGLPKN